MNIDSIQQASLRNIGLGQITPERLPLLDNPVSRVVVAAALELYIEQARNQLAHDDNGQGEIDVLAEQLTEARRMLARLGT